MVRIYLAIFSSVAPVSSILTYFILGMYPLDIPQNIWTGLVLLFSAGSFLYVATIHVLPEISEDHSHSNPADRVKKPLTKVPPLLSFSSPSSIEQTSKPSN